MNFDDLGGVVRERFEQSLPPADDTIVALKASLNETDARKGLHVRVHEGQKSVQVASIEGVDDLVVALYVFLRHARAVCRRATPLLC
jgi:hypothetical protein